MIFNSYMLINDKIANDKNVIDKIYIYNIVGEIFMATKKGQIEI